MSNAWSKESAMALVQEAAPAYLCDMLHKQKPACKGREAIARAKEILNAYQVTSPIEALAFANGWACAIAHLDVDTVQDTSSLIASHLCVVEALRLAGVVTDEMIYEAMAQRIQQLQSDEHAFDTFTHIEVEK